MIDRITGIGTLKNLKVLSIGRNYIKSLSGLVRIYFSNLINSDFLQNTLSMISIFIISLEPIH